MNVAELIEMLEGFDPDAEVRMAQQPSWPFEWSVSDVVEVGGEECVFEWDNEGGDDPRDENDEDVEWSCDTHDEFGNGVPSARKHEAEAADVPNIVYLAEGVQLGYLSGLVKNELGW